MSVPAHFFRHEHGRLVAALARRVGVRHLEAVEDAVQSALLAAVETWPKSVVPDSPSAWLFRAARNALVDELRRRARRSALDAEHVLTEPSAGAHEAAFLAGDVRDDVLRMLYVCCDDAIPVESQLVLALRAISGFGVREIAERSFTTEANVYKRLGRARARLRELSFQPGDLTSGQLAERLPTVRAIVYLLFTEGYLSTHEDGAIRRELCDEAVRLAELLAGHALSGSPETFALVALMHLHAARLPARQDGSGGLVLLADQDRSAWDRDRIARGLAWLARSAEGDAFTRYHAEAGVAAEHAMAPSFAETRWDRIVACYELLERLAPSPLHTLNRALATAEWRGAPAGLALLDGLAPPSWLAGSHLWSAVLADLHQRCGHDDLAAAYRAAALVAAPSAAVRDALERRLRNASGHVVAGGSMS